MVFLLVTHLVTHSARECSRQKIVMKIVAGWRRSCLRPHESADEQVLITSVYSFHRKEFNHIQKDFSYVYVPKLTYSVPEVCEALQISRTTVEAGLIAKAQTCPQGRRVLFSLKAVQELLNGESSGAQRSR